MPPIGLLTCAASPASTAADAELGSDALMHGVGVAAADLEFVVDAEELLQPLLQRLGALQLVLVVVDVRSGK